MTRPLDYGVDLDAWHEWGRGQWFLTYSYYHMGAGGFVDVPLQAADEAMARVEARKKWKDLMVASTAEDGPNPFAILAKDVRLSYRVAAVSEAEASVDIGAARDARERRGREVAK